jgi:excisionase family DNA binding protein
MHKRNERRQEDGPARARDVAETARVLGLGQGSVRGLLKAGKLRGVRVGRRTLISDEEIARFLREHAGRQVRL